MRYLRRSILIVFFCFVYGKHAMCRNHLIGCWNEAAKHKKWQAEVLPGSLLPQLADKFPLERAVADSVIIHRLSCLLAAKIRSSFVKQATS